MASFPRVGSATTAVPRNIFMSHQGKILAPGAFAIDADKSRDTDNTGYLGTLRNGLMIGLDTSTDLYRTAVIGVTAAKYHDGATTLTVSAAVATELSRLYGASGSGEFYLAGVDDNYGDNVFILPVTHSNINTSTGAITVSDINNTFEVGSFILPATVVVQDEVTSYFHINSLRLLVGGDDYGVNIFDTDGTTEVDQALPGVLVAGQIKTDMIINYPSDGGVKTWLKDELRRQAYGFVFSDEV